MLLITYIAMILLSFDVGIIHLSYCLFEITANEDTPPTLNETLNATLNETLNDAHNNNIRILKWGIVNITAPPTPLLQNDGDKQQQMDIENPQQQQQPSSVVPPPQTCSFIVIDNKQNKKNKKNNYNDITEPPQQHCCGKKALYQQCDQQHNPTPLYFCKKHLPADANQRMATDKINTMGFLRKQSLEDLRKYATTTLNLPEDTLATRKIALLEQIKPVLTTRLISPVVVAKKKTAGEYNLIELGRNMAQHMNVLFHSIAITHVIIENQIVGTRGSIFQKNSIAGSARMKTIQGMITQYFILKHPDSYIEFVSSLNKLKQLNGKTQATTQGQTQPQAQPHTDIEQQQTPTAGQKYKKHKTDAIEYSLEFIRKYFMEWEQVFMGEIKKDDMADSMLQGMAWLKKLVKL